jgi:predicted deacylase
LKKLEIAGVSVRPGETVPIHLPISELYTTTPVEIPITVIRGPREGPTGFVTAAVHGDEINGIEIVRRLIYDVDHARMSGALICVPVVNVLGFLSHSRYLPDRRDLNRHFPGDPRGHTSSRIASIFFREVVLQSDFGIDLHTAPTGRSNIPHLRADMDDPEVRRLARGFGASIIVHSKGQGGSLRRAAADTGVPTIVFEAGEAGRFNRAVTSEGLRGVLNVLIAMGMTQGEAEKPAFRVIVKDTVWVRAERGGIVDLRVRPGQMIYEGDIISVSTNPFGREVHRLRSPVTGMVIGTTSSPIVNPGAPICHIVKLKKSLEAIERAIGRRRSGKG